MVQKRTSKYASMTTSQLAAETRRRGLTKPEGMLNISEWADFLEAEDKKALIEAETAIESDEKPAKSSKAKKDTE